jgi:hypothetical protein
MQLVIQTFFGGLISIISANAEELCAKSVRLMSTDFSPCDFSFNFSLVDDDIIIEKQNNINNFM